MSDARWHAGLLLAALGVPLLWAPLLRWPWFQLAPLLLYGAVVIMVPALRRSGTWWRRGSCSVPTLAATLLYGSAVGLVLILWQRWSQTDVSDLRPVLGTLYPLWFAALNAAMEEVIWRGVLLDGLRTSIGDHPAVLVQGIAFGVLHAHGVPRGLLGQLLACLFGICQGELRLRAHGLLLPWVAHLVVDGVIFWLVLSGG